MKSLGLFSLSDIRTACKREHRPQIKSKKGYGKKVNSYLLLNRNNILKRIILKNLVHAFWMKANKKILEAFYSPVVRNITANLIPSAFSFISRQRDIRLAVLIWKRDNEHWDWGCIYITLKFSLILFLLMEILTNVFMNSVVLASIINISSQSFGQEKKWLQVKKNIVR